MTSRKIRFHPDASAEAEAAADWYEDRGAGLGADFVAEVDRVATLIMDAPSAWPPSRADSRARSAPFARFPYRLVFIQRGDEEIVIIAVAHGRRRPGYWRRRGTPDAGPCDVR